MVSQSMKRVRLNDVYQDMHSDNSEEISSERQSWGSSDNSFDQGDQVVPNHASLPVEDNTYSVPFESGEVDEHVANRRRKRRSREEEKHLFEASSNNLHNMLTNNRIAVAAATGPLERVVAPYCNSDVLRKNLRKHLSETALEEMTQLENLFFKQTGSTFSGFYSWEFNNIDLMNRIFDPECISAAISLIYKQTKAKKAYSKIRSSLWRDCMDLRKFQLVIMLYLVLFLSLSLSLSLFISLKKTIDHVDQDSNSEFPRQN